MTERSGYQVFKRPPAEQQGWDSMTQVSAEQRNLAHRLFDGLNARPYTSKLGGSPAKRAVSGSRSVHAWQRDYNTRGLPDEKPTTMRLERAMKIKAKAEKEAARRGIPAADVEKEIYKTQRMQTKRIDTGIRKNDVETIRAEPSSDGGKARMIDANERLQEGFSFQDAKEMFRGEAWQVMCEALSSLDAFVPPAEVHRDALGDPLRPRFEPDARGGARASFSNIIFGEDVPKALTTFGDKGDVKKVNAANDFALLKKHLIRKYGSATASWRCLLVPDGENGKGRVGLLAFAEWAKALRTVGFQTNAKALFQHMDQDDDGIVSFLEFEPEIAPKLKEFRSLLFKKYGDTIDKVWKKIDENGNNMLDPEEFEEICSNIGYEGASIELFRQLRIHPSRKFLTKEDMKAIPNY